MGFNLKKEKASENAEASNIENSSMETSDTEQENVAEKQDAVVEDKKTKNKKDKKTKVNDKKANAKESKKLREDKLKKIFNKQTFAIISVVGVLAVVLAYVFVYLQFTDKTSALEKSNRELLETVTQLEEYAANRAQYEQDIEDYTVAINEILKQYPADVREEDIVMLAVQMQQENEIVYNNIRMDKMENVYTVNKNAVEPAGIEGLDKDILFEQKAASYSNTTDYGNLKGCIEQIFSSDNRIAINEIIYTKNKETGELEGNIDLKFYCAKGTDKEYVLPDIAEYISGTSDFFKSGTVAVKSTEGTDEEGSDSDEGAGEDSEE